MALRTVVGSEIALRIEAKIPGAVVESDIEGVLVDSKSVASVLRVLKETPDLDMNYLNSLTAADYLDYFEVVYHLTSMANKHTLVVKTRVFGRENLEVPSVTHLWSGADYQEREVYDLLGIRFVGHPNLKRIALWDGFDGHPLRREFL